MNILKTASISDLKEIVNLDKLIIGSRYREDIIRESIKELRCYILKISDLLIGYGIFNYNFYNLCYIELLMVDKNYRNKGYGANIIEKIIDMSSTEKIFTSTNKSNFKMQNLLTKLGFIYSGEINNLDKDDPEKVYFITKEIFKKRNCISGISNESKLRNKYKFVKELVIENGEYLRSNFSKDLNILEKERGHLATKLDFDVEEKYKIELEKRFSDIDFYGEEKFNSILLKNKTNARWIVDSIDGTANYIFGIPYFGTSIALEMDNEIKLAIVYNPISDELYEAYSDEKNGYYNNKKISISKINKTEEQKFIFGYSGNYKNITKYYDEWKDIFEKCKKSIGMLAPSLNICNVARGKIEGFIDFGVSMEGQAAASLILKKAGGNLYNYDKSNYNYKKVGIIAMNMSI